MRRISVPALTLVALLPFSHGCGREGTATVEREEHAGDTHEAQEPSPGILRIEPTMLRDLRLTTARVEARPDTERVSLLGQLGVDETTYAEVGTPVPARVIALRAAPGDRVRKGAPLAELQSGELAEARGAAAKARTRLALAEQTLERRRRLAQERIVPLREVQEAEGELAASRAEVEAAEATLAALGAPGPSSAASTFVLRAPVTGTVLERRLAQGQMADPATPLFRIADVSRLWLTVHAFERDAVRVPVGAAAEVDLPAWPGRTFEGTVAWVGGEVDVTSRTIPIRIELANAGGTLRPGMSATARVATGPTGTPIVTVPATALQRMTAGWAVFLPRAADTFEIRAVGRGRDLGEQVEVLSGLRAGETVVVEGAFLLKAEAEKAAGGEEGHEH